MGWSNAVITNEGLALIAQAVSGDTLTINNVGLGSGTVDAAALMAQKSLAAPLSVPAEIAAKGALENGISVRVQIRNTGVKIAQQMRQVGLFAEIGTGAPILFAIMQNEIGEEIPSESEYPDFMIEFTAAIAVSNTDNITVTISSSAVITRVVLDEELKNYTTSSQFQSLLESVEEIEESKADATSVSQALEKKADTKHTHASADIKGLAAVATSGKYSDLSGAPESLPANGGNADTLDGFHASDFTLSNIRRNKPTVTCIVPLDSEAKLVWLPVENATKYAVSLYNNGKYTTYTNTLTATEYTVTGLTNGTEYQFLIQSYVDGKWSDFTTADLVTVRLPSLATNSVAGFVSATTQNFKGNKFVEAERIGMRMMGVTKGTIPETSQLAHIQFQDSSGANADSAALAQIYHQVQRDSGDSILTLQAVEATTSGSTNRATLSIMYGTYNKCAYVSEPIVDAGAFCLRNMQSGTLEPVATATSGKIKVPSGAWYGKHS